MMTRNDEQGRAQLNKDQPSASAGRMRRLRERRRKASRLITLEATAEDFAYLRLRGFLQPGENSSEHLVLALKRLLGSIR
jgi:hypothetical protein